MKLDPTITDYQPPTKLLSILVQGRNDNYMGNFSWRIATALNNHARNIIALGLENEIEILICDWGSEIPFWKDLELSSETKGLVKYLIVPPSISIPYDQDSGFAAPHPTNALARRSHGQYLIFSDSDIFIPLNSFQRLIENLRKGSIGSYDLSNSFFWGSKYHIPQDFVMTNPSIEALNNHIENFWMTYVREGVNVSNFLGCGVALLMRREFWLASRGWDERLIYWGWNDIDWTKRLGSRYSWNDLESFGMKMFHFEHYADRFGDYTKENPRKANIQLEPTTFAPNPDDWGLGAHTLALVDGYGKIVNEVTPSTNSKNLIFDLFL